MRADYLSLLALNNIIQVLTFDERNLVRQIMRGQTPVPGKQKISELLCIINKYKWERPATQWTEDPSGNRNLMFYDATSESWRNIKHYDHPIIQDLQQFKTID